jgi:hypothetical protein
MHYLSCSDGTGTDSTKSAPAHYTELMFLHPVESMGNVVHSDASGARNIDTLFLLLERDRYEFKKQSDGTEYDKLVFLHLVGSMGDVVHSSESGRKTLTHNFSCSDGTSTNYIKSAPRYVTLNLCFRI